MVLVTNALHHLPLADMIVVLRNGAIVESGSYDRLMEIDGYFSDMIGAYLDSKDETAMSKSNSVSSLAEAVEGVEKNGAESKRERAAGEEDGDKSNKQEASSKPVDTQKSAMIQTGQLIQDEDREVGDVDMKVYSVWAMAAGGAWVGPR